ncbi:von Ebner gland protein 2-like [Peromyscus eremicus]|uniref:von Ebner gland protein 2-like n=1 Tax=Peromyscus eremicus TaxID=42410 RepID=UPI0027DB4E3F|nr:von Ebner gland protein 2-like [Peromyscus eremicus]
MATMQLLLLTVALTLPSVEQSSYRNFQHNVTIDELLGKWYIVAWTGNVPIPDKNKFSPLPPFTFVRNIIGKLEFRMNISKPIGCVEFKVYMDKVKHNPGVFKIWPDHRIKFVFVRGKDFVIALYEGILNNSILTMLMGRNMAPKQTIFHDFEDVVVDVGLKPKNIISPKCDGFKE